MTNLSLRFDSCREYSKYTSIQTLRSVGLDLHISILYMQLVRTQSQYMTFSLGQTKVQPLDGGGGCGLWELVIMQVLAQPFCNKCRNSKYCKFVMHKIHHVTGKRSFFNPGLHREMHNIIMDFTRNCIGPLCLILNDIVLLINSTQNQPQNISKIVKIQICDSKQRQSNSIISPLNT